MSIQRFANNAETTLASGITDSDVTLTVQTGDGALFPSPTGGDWFLVTLVTLVSGVETAWEVVKCTARAGDVLTVVRGQESTAAASHSTGALVELRDTAGTLEQFSQVADLALKAPLASPTFTGVPSAPTAAAATATTQVATTAFVTTAVAGKASQSSVDFFLYRQGLI